mmetsp:Transcript_4983/g.12517  ORF Transcript_4983/g.12517 Transcript_4983/m.12517 type:complete len:262 (+) Transcript_4983:312-1097(+)
MTLSLPPCRNLPHHRQHPHLAAVENRPLLRTEISWDREHAPSSRRSTLPPQGSKTARRTSPIPIPRSRSIPPPIFYSSFAFWEISSFCCCCVHCFPGTTPRDCAAIGDIAKTSPGPIWKDFRAREGRRQWMISSLAMYLGGISSRGTNSFGRRMERTGRRMPWMTIVEAMLRYRHSLRRRRMFRKGSSRLAPARRPPWTPRRCNRAYPTRSRDARSIPEAGNRAGAERPSTANGNADRHCWTMMQGWVRRRRTRRRRCGTR